MLRLNSGADLLKSGQGMKGLTGFLLISMLLAACQGSEISLTAETSDYFPLEKGVYQVYEVHEKRYRSGGAVEESTYELKTEVSDSFPSGSGIFTYVLHRSTRSSPDNLWQPLDTWSVRRDQREVIVTEGNTPYVKIKLPYLTANRWDGNAYNTLGADEYMFNEVDVPRDFEGISFNRTVLVQQEHNDDPIVFRDEREEIYAADAGLVYKKLIQLRYCTDDACLGQQKIQEGTEMTMVIREYGKM